MTVLVYKNMLMDSSDRPRSGQAAIALLPSDQNLDQFAMLTSQMISCSENGKLTILYYTSEGASLRVCADDRCVSQRKQYGEMSVTLSSGQPFHIRILAGEGLCNYKPVILADRDTSFKLHPNIGLVAHFTAGMTRAILARPHFPCRQPPS
uniref:Uncharacterized protein n=1 Tax=Ditylenchus dipsaci TaxID=166011 RepID=A0A915D0I5_9BILA